MGQWIQIVLLVALFIVIVVFGVRFLSLTSSRSRAEHAHEDSRDLATSRHRAETEAQSLRDSVATEVEALRRAARVEAEASRTQAEAAKVSAETALRRAEATAEDLIGKARRQVADDLAAAREQVAEDRREVERGLAESRREQQRVEALSDSLAQREAELDRALASLRQRESDLEREHAALAADRAALDSARASVEADRTRALEQVSGMSQEQAKAELLALVESSARRDAAHLVRAIENEARADGATRARAIVVDSIQRVASEQTTETVVSVLHLPSDEMKGRIIGREGRNIRTFESVTGVNVIIDDTPEAVLLSCFDPVRREIGRITLEKLVLDGRIHPNRIEEVYELAKEEVDERCIRAARDAIADVGITGIDERLIPTIGRLKYRTSYGQNVLGHLIESAHIGGLMASELGLDPAPVKRAAFLHDIGKALTHEREGSHAIVGAALLRKYGEHEDIAHAVEAHHNEVQPQTVEAVLIQAADACSASRPGARRESLETYVKRLERIEAIAGAKPGVEKVFAMQAGREVRVMVQPNEVDDLGAGVIAREVAKQIEDELTYPGQIRVTVVRESRATEVAH